jgi:hypothetical protein
MMIIDGSERIIWSMWIIMLEEAVMWARRLKIAYFFWLNRAKFVPRV